MPASLAPHCVEIWRRWRLVAILLVSTLFQNFASASDFRSTLMVQKCYCDKFQAWDGKKCLDDVHTLLPIYNHTFDGSLKGQIDVQDFARAYPTEEFENVTVQDVQCSEGLYGVTLMDAFMLPDGRLLLMKNQTALSPESFCVVHFWQNGQAFFHAHACLPLPTVPHCCPEDHLLGRDGSCLPNEALRPSQIRIGEYLVDWDSLHGGMMPQTCKEHEYFHRISLREGQGQLTFTHPMARLDWSPPVWKAHKSWTTKYCVAMQEEAGELQFVAQICVKNYTQHHAKQCDNATCVRKCCPDGYLLMGSVCVEAFTEQEKWHPSQLPNQTINEEWKIVTGEPGCLSYTQQESLHLLPNGFLQLGPDIPAIPPSRYCLDNILDATETNVENIAIICLLPNSTECHWRDILIKVILGVSCVFLLATLGVYLGVAELRDQMYGRCLISMVTAMLAAYICFLIPADDFSDPSCYIKAFVTHLTSLAVFFWLNVMCFDMWKILRSSTRHHNSMTVFKWYSLYAWGCPLVISIVTVALDVAAPAENENLILPMYTSGLCWFNENAAYWLYFSGFILVLVVINVGFFLHVAVTLYQKMKDRTQVLESGSNRTNKTTKSKQRVWLFVKLFLVMGVLWITDVLSVVGHRRTCTYWVFSDIINSLQGVFIFIVAVCNKDNLKKIKDVWRPRFKSVRETLPNLTSRRPTQTNTLSTYNEDSRKTSVTSLPRKISQASSILFGSGKKSATLNPPPDCYTNPQGERKGSNVSVKDIIPMSTMQE